MLGDLRYACRTLRKTPTVTLIALLTLALGIGSVAASFSVLNALLFRPLPFIRAQERMLYVNEAIPAKGIGGTDICYADFLEWRRRSRTLEAIWLYDNRTIILAGTEEPERVLGSGLTRGAFQAMGVQPVLGRNFRDDEDDPKAAPVALLGYGLWQRHFGGRADVIGRVVTLNGRPTTIVGVMPDGWRYPETADLWVPLAANTADARHAYFEYSGHAMLKPGVALAQARAELATIAAALATEFPGSNTGLEVVLRPVREEAAEDVSRLSLLLFGGVLFVFLIACANVANLLLTRATARTKEFALRLALGAGRAQLLRQLLTESLGLGVAGGLGGLLFCLWGLDLMLSAVPIELPFWFRLDFDPLIFGVVFGLSLLASIISGIFPALQASRPELLDEIKETGRHSGGGVRSQRLRHGLVILELALALVLLTGAGLLLRSFNALGQVKPGFAAHGVLTFRLGFPPALSRDPAHHRRFFHELESRLATLPGVDAVGMISAAPGLGIGGASPVLVEGQSEPTSLGELPFAQVRTVTLGIFATLRIPLVAGRTFNATDTADHPRVAVVDEDFAHKYFPAGNALGRRFRAVSKLGDKPDWIEIIGIVGSTRRALTQPEPNPSFYFSHEQNPFSFMTVALRTSGDPLALAPAVRKAVLALDRGMPIYNVNDYETALARSIWIPRAFSWFFTAFAGIALFLACIGTYGVMAYSVEQRTHEIGVRMALGAQTSSVIRLILRRGLSLVAVGLSGGLVAAFFSAQLLAGNLYGITPHDPLIFILVSVVLAAIGILACLIPAHRATQIDPMIALRAE